MMNRVTRLVSLGGLLALTVSLAVFLHAEGRPAARASHSPATVDRVAVDTNLASNTANTIGTLQSCVIVPSVGQTTQVDVIVGPIGIPSARPLIGVNFNL